MCRGICCPNLYTLRGDVPRPAAQWVASLDVSPVPAEALAEGHSRSIVGAEASRDHLRNYRDVIAWTHDQSVRFMNKATFHDQIVERLEQMPRTCGLRDRGDQGLRQRGPRFPGRSTPGIFGFNQGQGDQLRPQPRTPNSSATTSRRSVVRIGSATWPSDQSNADDDPWAIEVLGYLVRHDPSNGRARQLAEARPPPRV